MTPVAFEPLPSDEGMSDELRKALESRFDAMHEEQHATRAMVIQMRDSCRLIADSALSEMQRIVSGRMVPTPQDTPPEGLPAMRGRIPTLRDVEQLVEDKVAEATGGHRIVMTSDRVMRVLEEREVRADAQTWRWLKSLPKKVIEAALTESVRKVFTILLTIALTLFAREIAGIIAARSQPHTVAPASSGR